MTDPARDSKSRDSNSRSGDSTAAGESLPVWNLDDLYRSPDDEALQSDLAGVAADARRFAERWAGKIAGLSAIRLADAIEAYERIDERMSRLSSYAQLLHAGDQTDPEIGRFFQTVTEKLNDASAELVFFALELNRIEEERLAALYNDSARLRSWQPWLRDIRTFRNHQLSDDLERLLHDKQVAGRSAWNRLFDETIAALRFPLDGEDLTEAETLHRLSSPDRNGAGSRRPRARHGVSTTISGCSATSLTRWRKTRRLRTAGGGTTGRSRPATGPTISRMKLSMPWPQRFRRPIRGSRIATIR